MQGMKRGSRCISGLFGICDLKYVRVMRSSSVLQAVGALRNAPAALAVFLAGVAPVVLTYNAFFPCLLAKSSWSGESSRVNC